MLGLSTACPRAGRTAPSADGAGDTGEGLTGEGTSLFALLRNPSRNMGIEWPPQAAAVAQGHPLDDEPENA